MTWDPRDKERIWDSSEVLAEDLQDYQVRMVMMGFDVEALYPNLDIDKVGDRIREAVKTSNIKWEGVNYMEAVRYIALNWPESKCRSSSLRKVLPWRRKNHGTRPGVRGVGPKGPLVGDTEQWVFPRVILTPEMKLEIIGTVLSIAITALFHQHYYSFGGRMFRQTKGGPIGLRGTCALARMIMQIFDGKWEGRLRELCLKIWLYSRYMDDGRAAMPPIKPGWRWIGSSLKYCVKWEQEDQELSDIEITRRVILGTLNGVEEFLSFTIETEEDYPDRWLPTLDTKLRVDGSNQILYDFYEKPTSSNMTVQRRTAMGEDSKMQVLSNDLIRRLMNSSGELDQGAKVKIVDDYSQKLVNSGYKGEQLVKIITNGIKGYEGKVRRCREQGRPLHRSSIDSQGARIRKKLLAKSKWFKNKKGGRSKEDEEEHGVGSSGIHGALKLGSRYAQKLELKSVLFVEQSPRGELARRLRDALKKMEPTLGFRVKVVERTGRSLGSKFPLSNLWGETKCGRGDCRTCEQVGEDLPQCTKTNLVYENICVDCNPGATGRGELEQVRVDVPTVYIGETSRSIYERSREHWEGAIKNCPKNHMIKHNVMEHGGNKELNFCMKVKGYYKTALARQVAEAVMIRRRGGEGAILNSRGEFNRSHIPRLQIVEEEKEGATDEQRLTREQTNRLLREQDGSWERQKAVELGNDAILGPKFSPKKRSAEKEQEEPAPSGRKEKRRRKLKHSLIEGWGEQIVAVEPTTPIAGEPAKVDEEQQNPYNREQISPPSKLLGSNPAREQSLKQARMTGFLKPADQSQGSPTIGNSVTITDHNPPYYLGGSPRVAVEAVFERDMRRDQFETVRNYLQEDCNTDGLSILEDRNPLPTTGIEKDNLSPQKMVSPEKNPAPSAKGYDKPAIVRKPDVVVSAEQPVLVKGDNKVAIFEHQSLDGCTFKRRGKCVTHGCMDVRYSTTERKCVVKKDGTYG